MRFALVMLLLTFGQVTAGAGQITCDGSMASVELSRAGRIVYEISSGECLQTSEGQTCLKQVEVDKDWCVDRRTVLKVSCRDNQPQFRETPCPTGTFCNKGACLPPSRD